MSKAQTLRALVNQRLRAAAEDIFELFERTVAEVEEDCRRQQQRLLTAAYQPRVRLHRADDQQLLDSEEGKWTPGQDQEDPPEPLHIKEEEEEEVWTCLQGEQHGGLEVITVPPADEEEPQLSELHQSVQTEHLKTEEVREDGGEPEPEPAEDPDPDPPTEAKSSHPDSDTEDSLDWEETSEAQLGLELLQNHQVPAVDQERNTGEPSASSSGGAADSGQAGPYPSGFTCPFCVKQFKVKMDLVRHMPVHTGEKAYCCSTCGRCFAHSSSLAYHERNHTREKPHSCSVCPARFSNTSVLAKHMKIHTKPFGCSMCDKRFARRTALTEHERVHTGEKPFSCDQCHKRFAHRNNLKVHSRIHVGEKPYSCVICGKSYSQKSGLNYHMRIHGEHEPFQEESGCTEQTGQSGSEVDPQSGPGGPTRASSH